MIMDVDAVTRLREAVDTVFQYPGGAAAHLKGDRITPLLTVLSGSRLWGTCAPASDYDIRFIYHLPYQRYLTLDGAPTQVEFKAEVGDIRLDVVGYDVFKAMSMLRKGNAQVNEWLRLPDWAVIDKWTDPVFTEEALLAARGYLEPANLIPHYVGLVKEAIRDSKDLPTDEEALAQEIQKRAFPVKKLLYAFRGAVNALVIAQEDQYPPADLRFATSLLGSDMLGYDFLNIVNARGEEVYKIPRAAVYPFYLAKALLLDTPAPMSKKDPLRVACFTGHVERLIHSTLIGPLLRGR